MFNLMMLEKIVDHGLASFDIPFDEPALKALYLYVTELKKWNERMNLVGLKDAESIVRELLYDAFFLNSYVSGSESILDIGSGAGILAIPLKILNKEMRVFSIDKTLKKIQFQRHIQRTLKLDSFFPVQARIESLESLDVQSLVAKAFGSITDILTKGGGHIKKGGRAFLPRGKTRAREDVDGFILEEVIPYTLPDSIKDRTLFIYRKLGLWQE
jgi:16S rRNA (guanine527-N7)-methyltransferase